MSNYQKYLHIKVKSAGLIIEAIKTFPENVQKRLIELKEVADTTSSGDKFYVFGGDNIAQPLNIMNVSNMLFVLMNGTPVPSKPMIYNKIPKELHLKRAQVCDDMASTCHYHINNYYDCSNFVEQMIGDDGNYYNIYKNISHPKYLPGAELFKGYQKAMKSSAKLTTVIKDDEGNVFKVLDGLYNYSILRRYFQYDENHPLYVKIIKFINELLGTEDFQKIYNCPQMIYEIHKLRVSSPDVCDKIDTFVKSIKSDWERVAKKQGCRSSFNVWMYGLFEWCGLDGNHPTESNTVCTQNGRHNVTYIRNHTGDVNHYRIPIYLDMIVKVTDSRVEDALRNGRGHATILDGGMCSIMGLTDFEPVPNYEDTWASI